MSDTMTPPLFAAPAPEKGRVARIAHTIKISDLIVHKYSETDVLMKKAHKIAHELILKELRQGEFVRTDRISRFQLFFPNLTPDAGALRCSVIADRVFRAIKHINPAYREMAGEGQQADNPEPEAKPKPRPRAVSRPRGRELTEDELHAEEMRRQATQAIKMMAPTVPLRLEELISDYGSGLSTDRLKLEFHPLWTVAKKHVTAYRISPVEVEPDPLTESDLARTIVDVLGIVRAGDALEELLAIGSPAAMVVPVHLSTLESTRLRAPLIEALARKEEMFRKFLVCDLVSRPGDISRYRLREAVGYLRGRCRSISARLDLERPDFETFAEAGCNPVGVDWGDYAWDEERLMRCMDRFAAGAQRRNLNTYARGVTSRSGVLAAIAAGYSYIDGPGVHKPLAAPIGIRKFEMLDLYLGLPGPAAAACQSK